DCNSWCPLLINKNTGHYIPFPPQDDRTRALFGDLLERVGGASVVRDDAGTTPFRIAGLLFQNPGMITRMIAHALRLAVNGQVPFEFTRALLTSRAHTLGLGIHNFMDAKMVARADEDATIKARLDSCVFKGAVKRNGEWEAVPMCSMNQQTWSEVYDSRLGNPELLKQPQVFAPAEDAAPIA
ncbi:MAG: hypothetical protein M3032_09640, partial [Verrucomicrobiota bacterium]|nr:hypothetical protein [Verrucomicrobiota bacterium]